MTRPTDWTVCYVVWHVIFRDRLTLIMFFRQAYCFRTLYRKSLIRMQWVMKCLFVVSSFNRLDGTCTNHCRQPVLYIRPTLPMWDLWSSKSLSSLFQSVPQSFWKIHQYRNSESVIQSSFWKCRGQSAKSMEKEKDDGLSLLGKYTD